MNRVQDMYEALKKYLALGEYARTLIATHFNAIDFGEFNLDQDKGDEIVVVKIVEMGKFEEFKRLVEYRSGVGDDEKHKLH